MAVVDWNKNDKNHSGGNCDISSSEMSDISSILDSRY